jgi:hypothetical protein
MLYIDVDRVDAERGKLVLVSGSFCFLSIASQFQPLSFKHESIYLRVYVRCAVRDGGAWLCDERAPVTSLASQLKDAMYL